MSQYPAPRLDGEQAARAARFEAAPAAPESFDARAAVLRVQALAGEWEHEAASCERLAAKASRTSLAALAEQWLDQGRHLAERAQEIRWAIRGDDA